MSLDLYAEIYKVRGDDREGMREQQARWTEWANSLPKRMAPPSVQIKVVETSGSGRDFSRLLRNAIIFVAVLAALVVVVAAVGVAISSMSGPKNATEVVQSLEAEGMPIGESKTYTAENDPNDLLGRPGQYTSKVIFTDTRLKRHPIASNTVSE